MVDPGPASSGPYRVQGGVEQDYIFKASKKRTWIKPFLLGALTSPLLIFVAVGLFVDRKPQAVRGSELDVQLQMAERWTSTHVPEHVGSKVSCSGEEQQGTRSIQDYPRCTVSTDSGVFFLLRCVERARNCSVEQAWDVFLDPEDPKGRGFIVPRVPSGMSL
jgi:hypothetical protein